ncbi:MAG: hypothetical protein ABI306_10450 [Caulobacteraceae bacterium]
MNGAPISHIGGAVTADHGAIGLTRARALAAFYRLEAGRAAEDGARRWADLCTGRAAALDAATRAAALWRRAAGWGDPDAADTV